jgi:Mn-dependent DtxR family transcriptional regulator
MSQTRLPLTPGERRYLRALRDLENRHQPFTHRKMCERFKWKSSQASFDYMRRLIRKKYIDQHGRRLAFVTCPVLTTKGQKASAPAHSKRAA